MGKKITSNSKLLGFCSHLVTSLHITVNNCPFPTQPCPACLSYKRHLKLPALLWVPQDIFIKGGTAAKRHLEAHPTLQWGLGDPTPAPTLLCWDIT